MACPYTMVHREDDRMKRVFLLGALIFLMAATGLYAGFHMDRSLADSDASFWGEAEADYSGTTVAGAGDVNGDGYEDFLMAAPGNDESGDFAGKTYLFLGKASGWAMDTSLADADASFLGEVELDLSGEGVAGVGDVNRDGYDDFVIGAPNNSDAEYCAGQIYLFFGKPSGWEKDTSLGDADASFTGEAELDLAGWQLSGAGDVNNDGHDDFLIGVSFSAEAGYDAGQAYLILGKSSGWAMGTSLADADASFLGEAEYDYAGSCVADAGDVNADGYDDLLIGSYGNDEGADGAGQAYLILGKASGWEMDASLSDADASFIGEAAEDKASECSGVGDVNGDGYHDFMIGAHKNDEGGDYAGQVYLILGKASGWAMDTSLADANASFIGEAAGDGAGQGVSGVGDVNGDAYDDFIIAAPFNAEGGETAGQTYLILGRASGWAMDTSLADADASFIGEAPGDCSGSVVSGAGDVNGDGYHDIVIGAHTSDEGGDHAGQAYLIFGEAAGPAPGITVGVSTNSDSYEFGDVLQIDVSMKNTGMSAFVDIFVVLTFDLAGPEERNWSASATGEWTAGLSYYDTGVLIETGHDETTRVLSAPLPCQAPMIAKSGTYTLRMAAVEPGTLDFVSNIATLEFVLTGMPFVDVSTDKEAYSLIGDTMVISLDVALPDYSMTADFYVVLLAADGEFWSPDDFGTDETWSTGLHPFYSSLPTQPSWELSLDAFAINLPSGAPFDAPGQFTLFTALVEPDTLTPYSDIGAAGFVLLSSPQRTEEEEVSYGQNR